MKLAGAHDLSGSPSLARSLDEWRDQHWLALDLIASFSNEAFAAVKKVDRRQLALLAGQVLKDLFAFSACGYVSRFDPSGASQWVSTDQSSELMDAYNALVERGNMKRALRDDPPRPRVVPGAEVLVAPINFNEPDGQHFAAILPQGMGWSRLRGRMLQFVLDQVRCHFDALARTEDALKEAASLNATVAENREQIEFQSSHDPVTKLLAREALLRKVERRMVSGDSLCIVVLGLRGFSRVHYRFGYGAADSLLCEIAKRIDASPLRQSTEADLARITDDRFALVLSSAETGDRVCVKARVEQLCVDLGAGLSIAEEHIALSVLAGIAYTPSDADTAIDAVNAAELALDRVDYVVGAKLAVYSELDEGDRQDNSLLQESEISLGIENDDFQLWYQPKLRTSTGQIVGAEALMRWEHPTLGRISPAQFIPTAEQSGQILTLGEVALRQACRHISAWRGQGFDPGLVSVNLSPVQVGSADLPARFERILEEECVRADVLELEVTETAVSRNLDVEAQVIRELDALGFTISIDDFGTGHSSLLLLRELPIDVIKVDRAFIRELRNNRDDLAIVRAVLSMAKELSLKVIAEGVETREQFEYLRELGCDEIQGAVASMPLSLSDFQAFVQSWRGL